MAAARAWAAGQLIAAAPQIQSHDALADAERWGATPEELAGLRAQLGIAPTGLPVWRHNVPTVAAFVLAGTQWRTASESAEGRLRIVWVGLDYAGAKISIEASGMEITPEIWAGIRVMEAAARDALNGEVAR